MESTQSRSAPRKSLNSIKPTDALEAVGLELLLFFESKTQDVYFDAHRVTPELCRKTALAYFNMDAEAKEIKLPDKELHKQLADLLVPGPLRPEEMKLLAAARVQAAHEIRTAISNGSGGTMSAYSPSLQTLDRKAKAILIRAGHSFPYIMTSDELTKMHIQVILDMFGVAFAHKLKSNHPMMPKYFAQLFYPCHLLHEAAMKLKPNYEGVVGEGYIKPRALIKKLIQRDLPVEEIINELKRGDEQFNEIKFLFGCAFGSLKQSGLSETCVELIPFEKSVLDASSIYLKAMLNHHEDTIMSLSNAINRKYGINSKGGRGNDCLLIILGALSDLQILSVISQLQEHDIKIGMFDGKAIILQDEFEKVKILCAAELATKSASSLSVSTSGESKTTAAPKDTKNFVVSLPHPEQLAYLQARKIVCEKQDDPKRKNLYKVTILTNQKSLLERVVKHWPDVVALNQRLAESGKALRGLLVVKKRIQVAAQEAQLGKATKQAVHIKTP